MNNAAGLKTNFIIVLNDNNMSISKNVGGMSSYLSALRTAESYTGMKINVTKTLKKSAENRTGYCGHHAENKKQHQAADHSGHVV